MFAAAELAKLVTTSPVPEEKTDSSADEKTPETGETVEGGETEEPDPGTVLPDHDTELSTFVQLQSSADTCKSHLKTMTQKMANCKCSLVLLDDADQTLKELDMPEHDCVALGQSEDLKVPVGDVETKNKG